MLHEGKTTNPTMVSGRELAPGEDVPLTDGVSIQLGRVLVTFHEKRLARRVSSDILLLEVDRAEVTIDPGRQDTLNLRLVNATGRVEQVEVAIDGHAEGLVPDRPARRDARIDLAGAAGSDRTGPEHSAFPTRWPLRRWC